MDPTPQDDGLQAQEAPTTGTGGHTAQGGAAKDGKRPRVAKSKQIAEKYEKLLQAKFTTFARVEIACVALSLFSLIIAAIAAGFSPALTYNAFPLTANILIILVGSFGASLAYLKNALDKRQVTITTWFSLYVIIFIFAIIGQVFLILNTVILSVTCNAIAQNDPQAGSADEAAASSFCKNSAVVGLYAFNCVLFFVIFIIRGVTLWMGYQLYMLLTKTLNAVVRATAKVDMRRSLSNNSRASFHSVDGSERIIDSVPRKPVPQFAPSPTSKTELTPPDPILLGQQ